MKFEGGEKVEVRLVGGGPWGFRLKGGAGNGQPLTVAKTRRKSKAHNRMFEGDIVLSINGHICDKLTHDDAMAIVDEASNELIIELLRPDKGKENVEVQPENSPFLASKTDLISQPTAPAPFEKTTFFESLAPPLISSTASSASTTTTTLKEIQNTSQGKESSVKVITETTTYKPSGMSTTFSSSTTTFSSEPASAPAPKKVPPPTLPKPKLKLITSFPSETQQHGFGTPVKDGPQSATTNGCLTSPTGQLLLPKFYEPPSPEDMMDLDAFKSKKKMFSSSSFYEEPKCIYPTVEEQVELCRKIADSLSADTNRTSKGANMFFKRVKRSHKWVHEMSHDFSDSEATQSESEKSGREDIATPDPNATPYIKVSKGPAKLKLILDPRQLQDAIKLRSSGQNIVEHNAVSPEVCLDLVRDLNSPCGKGAALFAKRKKKSEEWVVDEEKVKAQLGDRWPEPLQPQPQKPLADIPIVTPVDKFKERLQNPRLKLVKSPWEAALESPIGCCAGAFKEVRPDQVAESVIRAAEAKGIYDSPAPSPVPGAQSPLPYFSSPLPSLDPLLARAPRGWRGTTTSKSSEPLISSQPTMNYDIKEASAAPAMVGGKFETPTFKNFNTIPRSWTSSSISSDTSFRPVKPPAFYKQ